MKKILFMGAMAAMLLGTASCSNEVDQPTMGDEVNAAFSVSMDGIESRTISDGLTVNELYFEVYEAKTQGEGESATTTYTKLPSLSQKVDVASKTATVTTKLIKGKTYKFAFWAQKEGAYNAADLQNIQMNYANANDENRDAFFANVEKTVTAAFDENVTLYRPFAQINFGASDVDAAMDISGFTSQLVVKNVPNQFNVLSGVASGEEAEVTLAATAVPARIPEPLKVDGKDYTYISMNYILATPEKATKDITLTVKDGDTEVKKLPVSACPMQRNYRTNILGDILSVEGKFNITVDPIYTGDLAPEKAWDGTLSEPADITGDIIEIKDGSELAWVMNSVTNGSALAGKTFKLTNDINLGKRDWPLVISQCTFTLDGNGKTIKGLKSTGSNYGGLIGKPTKQIEIKNLTISDSEIDASVRTDNENGAGAFIGWYNVQNSKLDNCKAENVIVHKAQYNGALVGYTSGISIKNCTVSNCEIVSEYSEIESGNTIYKGHSGCVVGYGDSSTNIEDTRVANSKITGQNDKKRVGIFYGTAQASVTIGTGNSVKNVTILGTPATSANLVGALDNRSDKSNDGTVVFE